MGDVDGDGGIDPISLEVIDNRIDEIVREMQHVMFRTGYSTIIRDSKDGSAGVCLPDGRVIGQAFRLPLHCGVFPPTIEAIHEYYDLDDIAPGDTFVMNDPYLCGACHTPDLLVATPVFHGDKLRAYCVTIAHKPDIGGIAPGSMSADAREIYHEGLLLPPVKYRHGGDVDPAIENVIRNNSRTPEVTMGDVRGQVGSTNVGVDSFRDLLDEYGPDTVATAADRLIAGTRREIAATVEPWDGEVTVTGTIDGDVTSDEPIEIVLTVTTTAGDGTLAFDFAGSDPQSAGPSNIRPHVTTSACMNGVVGIVNPDLPLDAGVRAAMDITIPEGTIVNPTRPAPCGNYAKGLCVVTHLSLRALTEFQPDLGVAETGNKASIAVNYRDDDDDEDVVHFEIMGSGYGGSRRGDGASCMATTYESNVRFTPLEILETEYPVRVTEFSPRIDSAGPGRHRGGVGFVREYEPLTPVDLTYNGSNHATHALGVAGGGDAPTARCTVLSDGDERPLDTMETVTLDAGDRVRIERPGGAGYGDPLTRDPDAVLRDVRRRFVSAANAESAYGVIIEDDGDAPRVDESATRRRRGD